MKVLQRYRFLLFILLFDFYILLTNFPKGQEIIFHTAGNFREMLGIIPPIFILLGLLDVWVPRETIIKYLGPESGFGGIFLSIILGTAAAGPLYGAFPVAAVMAKKGAKYTNIITFLGSWSTLKIPLFLFEMSALGPKFAITRALINIHGIIFLAFLIDRFITQEEKAAFYKQHAEA